MLNQIKEQLKKQITFFLNENQNEKTEYLKLKFSISFFYLVKQYSA